MPFKIVQTREDGDECLCVVPSGWEKGGVLWWPNSTNAAKLVRDENLLPSSKWKQMRCIKKREYRTILEAETELQKMEALSDTEAEERAVPISVIPAKKPRKDIASKTSIVKLLPKNFNELVPVDPALQIATPPQQLEQVVQNAEFLPSTSDLQNITVLQTVHNQVGDETVALELSGGTFLYTETDTSDGEYVVQSRDQSGIKQQLTLDENAANQAIIIKHLTNVLNNQAVMITALAHLKTTSDFHNVKLEKLEAGFLKTPIVHSDDVFQPVDSQDMFDAMENSLKDETVMSKYIKLLTPICGSSGKEDGIDCCYRLIDHFVTRQFLTKCSWTGISRSDTQEGSSGEPEAASKIAFMNYKRIRQLFLKLIVQADFNFNAIKCDEFLKRVIKNSKQRLLCKADSKHKNRPSKLHYGAHQHAAQHASSESDI